MMCQGHSTRVHTYQVLVDNSIACSEEGENVRQEIPLVILQATPRQETPAIASILTFRKMHPGQADNTSPSLRDISRDDMSG